MTKPLEFYKDCRDRSQLPDDVDTLKDIIVYQWQVIDDLQKDFHDYRQKTDFIIEQLMKKIESLEHEVSVLRRNRFGQRSERKKKPSSSGSSSKEDSSNSKGCANHPGRNPLPDHLKREEVCHDLKASDRICPLCQSFLTKINDITTEQLDIIPCQLIVKQHKRFQYACKKCYGTIKLAEIPAQPIDKGLASADLLAHLIVEKYDYYLPCYRLERWFAREGVDISRSTMWGWFLKSYHLLEPLVDVMHQQEIVKGDHVFTDDTTMPTLDPGAGKTKTGRMWVYIKKGTKDHNGVTVYQYTTSREGKYPVKFLKEFKGYVQADAYSGFNGLFVKDEKGQWIRKELGCWAHVRRKFFEIAKAYPNSIAEVMVDMIGQLYAVEKAATLANLCDGARRGLRKRKSKTILKKIYKWLKYHQPKVVPKSPLGQAIAYTLNNWCALGRFLADGKLEIDNNRSERKMKPIVISRKNHMFVGSEEGGKAAAVFYSLIETCRDNDINPKIYLADVLRKIPTHPNKRIRELLPYNWKKSNEQPNDMAA